VKTGADQVYVEILAFAANRMPRPNHPEASPPGL
jgi:hypothetical protein